MKFLVTCGFALALWLPLRAQDTTIVAVPDSTPLNSDTVVAHYFADLGIPIDSCSNPALYNQVCEWIEVPYKYAGKTRSGIDCSGFAKQIYSKQYALKLTGGSRDLYKRCQPVERENLMEGDLLFFKIYSDKISHVGVYLRDNKFVHASTKRGVIVSDLREKYYDKRFFKGGRIILAPAAQPDPPAVPATDTLQRAINEAPAAKPVEESPEIDE